MKPMSRTSIWVFSYLFVMNYLVLGLPWYGSFSNPEVAWIPFAMYFGLVTLLIFFPGYRHIPIWLGGLGLVGGVTLVALSNSLLDPTAIPANGSFTTWYVGAASAMFAIIAGRGHRVMGIVGVGIEVILVVIWGGFPVALTSGVVGAVLLVVAVSALSKGIDSAISRASGSKDRQRELELRLLANQAARTQREHLVQRVLELTFPTLERIVHSKGKLSAEARGEARQVELMLRDELNNRELLNPEIRVAIRQARARGVKVSFRDEVGLGQLGEAELLSLQKSVAKAINGTQSGTVTIRTQRGENFLVKVVAQRPDSSKPDLWLTLP